MVLEHDAGAVGEEACPVANARALEHAGGDHVVGGLLDEHGLAADDFLNGAVIEWQQLHHVSEELRLAPPSGDAGLEQSNGDPDPQCPSEDNPVPMTV